MVYHENALLQTLAKYIPEYVVSSTDIFEPIERGLSLGPAQRILQVAVFLAFHGVIAWPFPNITCG